MNQTQAASIAAQFFSTTTYCALGTVSPDSSPWVTPIYFSTTPALELIWVSALDAQHSKNIGDRPRITAAFYDSATPFGNGQGLYVTASARELTESELADGCNKFYSRRYLTADELKEKARKPADFLEPSPRRMYMATIDAAWVLDPGGHPTYGRLIDHRVPVDLGEFRQVYLRPLPPPTKA